MSDITISDDTRERLAGISTATLTTQLFKRGLSNVFLFGLQPANPAAVNFVAEAFTLRYIPSREDIDTLEVFKDYDHPQRKAVETVPLGQALVIDCRGVTNVASAGSILVTRLMVRGAAAVVSDGGLRDWPEIAALDFPAFAAGSAAPTNLTRHHAIEALNEPIGCAGVAVYPGDVLVGDAEGVVVIPRYLAAEVAVDGFEQERQERFLTAKVRGGSPLRGVYPPDENTVAEYEAWKAAGEPEG
ncbi:MAG TPA: ribonuclease activity regulator RraA [Alphaproteobacteria bacterium]|jgi:regulator of RNase E activity RraA|nr:ribonuclease activity regulator RraA [Alphaproteobacteria bacterium]